LALRLNKSRISELQEKLMKYDRKLRKRTTASLKKNELVKEFHIYKAKQEEMLQDKLQQFKNRELFSLQQEVEKMRVEHKKLKLEHYRLQKLYFKKIGYKEE